MGFKRFTCRTIAESCSLIRTGAPWRRGLRILLYHSVGSRLAHDSYGISIQPELFQRHMRLLRETREVSLTGLCDPLPDSRIRCVAVTFDDGYKDNLYAAAPTLLDSKIPFSVFVTTSFLQKDSGLYLSPRELRELATLPGVNIGSHGASHSPLINCDDLTLREELYESRCRIEDVIGQPVKAIAYPHGAVNRRVRDAALRAGYSIGVCSRFDINEENRDRLLLCRCEVLANDSERVLVQKLSGAWDWYRWRSKDPLYT